VIRHEGEKWVLYTADGSRVLGTHATEAEAQAQERLITAKKSRGDRVDRFDVGRLGTVTRTPTGGLRIPASISRTGLQEYRRVDGSIRVEYRPPEEVQASLPSFEGASVTIGHPPGAVDPSTWRHLSVGVVSDRPARLDSVEGSPDRWAVSEILVTDADAIAKVERRDLSELSAGYSCALDETPGVTPEGARYDAVQRQIEINHVALLKSGCARAGRHARLRLDGHEEVAMPMITVDSVEYEMGSPSHLSALAAQVAKRDARITELEVAAGTAQAKLDASEKQVKELSTRLDGLDAAVEARGALLARVKPILGEKYDAKGKSADQIRRDALAVLKPEQKLDGQGGAYVEAYFDLSIEQASAASQKTNFADTARADSVSASTVQKPWEIEAEFRRKLREDSYK
jgi:hypothetical protein